MVQQNMEKDNQIKMLEFKLNRSIDEGAGKFADKLQEALNGKSLE